jgi:hypothetical protein
MKSTIVWDITPCSPLSVNGRFGGTYCLHLQLATCFHPGSLLRLFFRPWRWRRYVALKSRLTLNGLHGVISQKTVLFINKYNSKLAQSPLISKWKFLWLSTSLLSMGHTIYRENTFKIYWENNFRDNVTYLAFRNKLRGFGLLANHAARATAACWRSTRSTNFCG